MFSRCITRFASSTIKCNNVHSIYTINSRSMAGHSKWQNIRHIKAANDKLKSDNNQRHMTLIRTAARLGGGMDPKLNRQLQRAIENAKKENVPKATIDNFLKKMSDSNASGTQSLLEVRGPFGTSLIVDIFTNKMKHSKDRVKFVLKKYGATMDTGCAMHNFEQKGVLYAVQKDGVTMSFDDKEEAAIEMGAEDVKEDTVDGADMTLFITDPKDLHAVKGNLPEDKFTVEHANIEFLPVNLTEVSDEEAEKLLEMIDRIEELEFVTKIYDNVTSKAAT